MTIAALPASTVRALTSGQVLTDPVSLIKELLENSLDAGATRVAIEVTNNLLDVIKVTDDGFGIIAEDRPYACKRHWTSKITCFEDIAEGIETLGFRGEALASAAEMSEKMSFTTRCDGEPVGEVYDVDKKGEVKSKRNIGAPLGTTVKVEGFLKKLPVRREAVVRGQKQSMKKLKSLVATYYLSRPKCRFSLKVLKGGESMVYTPSQTIPGAVRNVVGKEVMANCVWKTKEADGIAVEAFVAKPDGDVGVLEKPLCDKYVYIDSRPVSCAKGTFQTIHKLYKSYIRTMVPKDARAPSNPMFYLHIRCPKGIYDANIEPAKNDILFDGSKVDVVLSVVEGLFKEIYGELPERNNERTATKSTQASKMQDIEFDILLAKKKDAPRPEPGSSEQVVSQEESRQDEEPASDKEDDHDLTESKALNTKERVNPKATKAVDNEESEEAASVCPKPVPPIEIDETPVEDLIRDAEEMAEIQRDPALSNPWTITKMHSPTKSSTSDIQPTISFSPVNPRPRTERFQTPSAKPRSQISLPTPMSTPRSAMPTLGNVIRNNPFEPPLPLDPDNAGAMDKFVVRAPRAGDSNKRPIPRELYDEDEIGPSSAQQTSPPDSTKSRPRLQPAPLLSPPRSDPPPARSPNRGFTSAARIYDRVGSQQADFEDSQPRRKRRRVYDANHTQPNSSTSSSNTRNPNRNRFLRAIASLQSSPAPTTAENNEPVEEDESPRFTRRGVPKPLPPWLLNPPTESNTTTTGEQPAGPSIEQPTTEELPAEPSIEQPPEGQEKAPIKRRRRTTRTLPAEPLLPLDPDYETYKFSMEIPSLAVSRGKRDATYGFSTEEYGFCFDTFDKEEIGDVVKTWIEKITGVVEDGVSGWELVEDTGIAVMKAVVAG